MVKFLVEFPAEKSDTLASVLNANGDHPIHDACCRGHCSAVKVLIGWSPSLASVQNASNKLPIQILCEAGGDSDAEFVETLWTLLRACPQAIF